MAHYSQGRDDFTDIWQHRIIQVADESYRRPGNTNTWRQSKIERKEIGRRPGKLIIFSATYLPPKNKISHHRLLKYMIYTLDQYVNSPYTLIYFHHGLNSNNKPSYLWLRKAYRQFDRRYKKNLKALFVVHPTKFIKRVASLLKPLLSSKFNKKLKYINYIHEMDRYAQLNPILIPTEVKRHDQELLKKNFPKNRPAPSYQYFGVSLERLELNCNGDIIPWLMTDAVDAIRTHGLDTEGLFRIPATDSQLKSVINEYNLRGRVNLYQYDGILCAALIKAFLRELPKPLISDEFHRDLMRMLEPPHVDDVEYQMSTLRRILLDEMPYGNYCVLKFFVEFLVEVARCEENMMTPQALALCVAPNIIRRHPGGQPTKLSMEKNAACLLTMIYMYDELFLK